MIKPELYQRTVDILVEAYFKNTLQAGNCFACAIGNIIAANTGKKLVGIGSELKWEGYKGYHEDFSPDLPFGKPMWSNLKQMNGWIFNGVAEHEDEAVLRDIDKTGYSVKELLFIEKAFENGSYGKNDDEWIFNGVIAVIDVLDKIHENADAEATNVTKQRFSKQI